MEYRTLGSSDLRVSVFAFGAWQLGDANYWGAEPEADAEAAVAAAIDGGINLFDTAEMYGDGESERVLGRLLGNKRKDVLVASKVSSSHCAPQELRTACEASLTRLGTDYLDLYQVHWPARDVPFEATYAEMARLKAEGKIREIGVSNFGAADLADWTAYGACVSNQLGYNLAFRAIEYDIVPACQACGAGILAYMPLLQGILSGRWRDVDSIPQARRRTRHFSGERAQVRHGQAGCEAGLMAMLNGLGELAEGLGASMADVALAWAVAQPGITSVIVGARNPAQLKRNLKAAALKLDDDALQRLDGLSRPVKEHLGKNADMWSNDEESRIR